MYDLLNRAYSLFSICDSFPELFQISYELLKKHLRLFRSGDRNHRRGGGYHRLHKEAFYRGSDSAPARGKRSFFSQLSVGSDQKETGMSYINYVSLLRMEYAEQLLTGTNLKVSEVAAKCGYHDNSCNEPDFPRAGAESDPL